MRPSPLSTPGSRRDRPPRLGAIGSSLGLISPNACGAPRARATAPTATAGGIFRSITRWSEDGLAGLSDREQRLCFALSFWNGRDPILNERIFGLSGPEGNHGQDAKEYWWSLDATPTYSWLRWRYHYPQAKLYYERLRQENAKRTREQPEFELLDSSVFDGERYWQITAEYAKAASDDV
jgi:hypothetical protein